jgi:hypothetical protein
MKRHIKLFLSSNITIALLALTSTLAFANTTATNTNMAVNTNNTHTKINTDNIKLIADSTVNPINSSNTNASTNGSTGSTKANTNTEQIENSNHVDNISSDDNSYADIVALSNENSLLGPKDVLAVVSKMYENKLPKKVSDDLILDKVSSHDNTISFDYQFLSLESSSIKPKFDLVMTMYLTEQTCSVGEDNENNANNFLLLLTQGAQFQYNLYDKHKKLIRSFNQNISKCFTNFDD